MPYLSTYNRIVGALGSTNGRNHKIESDMVMEQTWYDCIESQVAYFYDWYHDDEPLKLNDLNSTASTVKTPIEIKFLMNSSQTLDKDRVSFHIQFRPSHSCTVSYYDEFFTNRYKATYPSGLYVDIMDEKGKYNRWLVIGGANDNVSQFPTYEVLRCDFLLQYVLEGKKWQVPCVLRSQSS